LDIAPVFE